MKKFRQSPEIEGFYRFVFENDLQSEAYDILDRIVERRKALRPAKGAAAKAAQAAAAAQPKAAPAPAAKTAAKAAAPAKATAKAAPRASAKAHGGKPVHAKSTPAKVATKTKAGKAKSK